MLKMMLAALVVAPVLVATATVGKVVRDEAKRFLADMQVASDQVADLTSDEAKADLAADATKDDAGARR